VKGFEVGSGGCDGVPLLAHGAAAGEIGEGEVVEDALENVAGEINPRAGAATAAVLMTHELFSRILVIWGGGNQSIPLRLLVYY